LPKDVFYQLTVNYSMHVFITVFDFVICKTPDAPLHSLPFLQGNMLKW